MNTMALPSSFADVQELAFQNLEQPARVYFESGADDMQTACRNIDAFDRLLVRQKRVADTGNEKHHLSDTTIDLLGQTINSPICVAPTGMKKIAHPGGESAAAKAASRFGTCLCVSTSYCVSSPTSFQQLTEAAPRGLRWLQLYIYRDRSVTERIIRQAEDAGFKAILLTVDSPTMGFRIAHLRKKDISNPGGSASSSKYNLNFNSGAALFSHVSKNFESNLSWDTVAWLKSKTKLPILLKGILSYEDAIDCVKYGVQGICVSNHGGRQLDCLPAAIEALPEVVRAVQGKIPVFVDGGIRRGSDVFKALALGAQAVFIGRPIGYGLAYNGENGAHYVLELLTKELKEVMRQTDCKSIKDINPSLIAHQSIYGPVITTSRLKRNWTPNAEDVLCVEDILHSATQKGLERTPDNRIFSAYKRFLIRLRVLQGIKTIDSSVDLYGTKLDLPFILSTSQCRNKAMFDAALHATKMFSLGAIVDSTAIDSNSTSISLRSQTFMLLLTQLDLKRLPSILHEADDMGCKAVIIDASDLKLLHTLRKHVNPGLSIIVTGITSTHDALECCKHGVQGMIVSEDRLNDGEFSTVLDRFSDIVKMTNYSVPVFYEGAVLRGTDVFKLLALGARAVIFKQQIDWGFLHQGEHGVKEVLGILKDELRRAMMLAGCGDIKNITSSMVVRNDHYWRLSGLYRSISSHL